MATADLELGHVNGMMSTLPQERLLHATNQADSSLLSPYSYNGPSFSYNDIPENHVLHDTSMSGSSFSPGSIRAAHPARAPAPTFLNFPSPPDPNILLSRSEAEAYSSQSPPNSLSPGYADLLSPSMMSSFPMESTSSLASALDPTTMSDFVPMSSTLLADSSVQAADALVASNEQGMSADPQTWCLNMMSKSVVFVT